MKYIYKYVALTRLRERRTRRPPTAGARAGVAPPLTGIDDNFVRNIDILLWFFQIPNSINVKV